MPIYSVPKKAAQQSLSAAYAKSAIYIPMTPAHLYSCSVPDICTNDAASPCADKDARPECWFLVWNWCWCWTGRLTALAVASVDIGLNFIPVQSSSIKLHCPRQVHIHCGTSSAFIHTYWLPASLMDSAAAVVNEIIVVSWSVHRLSPGYPQVFRWTFLLSDVAVTI